MAARQGPANRAGPPLRAMYLTVSDLRIRAERFASGQGIPPGADAFSRCGKCQEEECNNDRTTASADA
ncbi:hypothetical protein GCM10027168_12950 [Streptomyces capparidis]